jgi:hypothetical protein
MGFRAWSIEERRIAAATYAQMARLFSKTAIFRAIGARVGRSADSVGVFFYKNGATFACDRADAARKARATAKREVRQNGAYIGASVSQIADRDARAAAAERRTYTQEFFGDPPPGFSALDRKRQGLPMATACAQSVLPSPAPIGEAARHPRSPSFPQGRS